MITKEKAIEIIEKFDFFQGQRAGRELWAEKPTEIQEQDLKQFQSDCKLLKEYVQTIQPQGIDKDRVEHVIKVLESCKQRHIDIVTDLPHTR